MKTSLLVETHPLAAGHLVRALLRIEGDAPEGDRRVPLNLALVLDRSGSMGGGKLDAVKDACRDLIRRLHPEDRVSVVAFDGQVATVANPGTAAEQRGLLDALMGIEPRGSTNLSGGWLQGRALVEEYREFGGSGATEGVNRILLLTDGQANRGITDRSILRKLCAQALESRVTTTTVGVGGGYDEELLGQMAEAGGGSSYYIERLDQAGGVFEDEVEGLLSLSAQNLTVSLRPRDAVEVATVHHSYPSRAHDNGALTLTVGDLYAREPREVLADFVVLPEQGAGTSDGETAVPVLELVVEADCWTEGGGMERRKIFLPVTFEPANGAVTHPEVHKVFTLLEAARARREAVSRGDRGDIPGAVRELRASVRTLRESGVDDEAVESEVRDLLNVAESMEAQQAMSSEDRKYMYSKERLYSRSRRMGGDRTRRE
ncbi:MAG: VWA domain-containing protein [Longimicrobiales bacterium]|nr:VWA domain-containing protein [Longimicrobiales bacterium]